MQNSMVEIMKAKKKKAHHFHSFPLNLF